MRNYRATTPENIWKQSGTIFKSMLSAKYKFPIPKWKAVAPDGTVLGECSDRGRLETCAREMGDHVRVVPIENIKPPLRTRQHFGTKQNDVRDKSRPANEPGQPSRWLS